MSPQQQAELNAKMDAAGRGIPGTVTDVFTSTPAERKAGRHADKYGYGFPKGSPEAAAAMKSARAKAPRQGRFITGSQQARDHMEKLRAMRK